MTDSPGLQTVLNRFLPDYQKTHPLDARRRQVCLHIGQCRTPALGGLQLHCDHCEYAHPCTMPVEIVTAQSASSEPAGFGARGSNNRSCL
jgi:hypothetical protein